MNLSRGIVSWMMSASSDFSTTCTVVVGLNGALQKRFVLAGESCLVPGNVHRAKDVQIGVGGKGQDVAITLSCLNYKDPIKLAQFLGVGAEGNLVYDLLKDRIGVDDGENDDAMSLTVRSESPLRTCTSIVASDVTTELVEPSGIITEEEMTLLMTRMEALVSTKGKTGKDLPNDDGTATEKRNEVAALCIMGTMPPGCPPETYAEMYKRICSSKTFCIIDTVIGVEPLLQTIGNLQDHSGTTIFKVNASELCKLAKVSPNKASDKENIDVSDVIRAICLFLNKFGGSTVARKALSGIAITDGKHPAYFAAVGDKDFSKTAQSFTLFQIRLPNLLEESATIFPIGAGDAVAAGTLAAWRCLSVQKPVEETVERDNTVSIPSLPPPSPCLHYEIQKALIDHMKKSQTGDEMISSNVLIQTMLSSFAFGLACGSASCLQQENSVLQKEDVLRLYGKEKITFLMNHLLE